MAKKKNTPSKAASIPVDAGREEREKALASTLTEITKRYGDGTVVKLGEARHLAVDTISTGSLAVDIALGVGGLPRGRITEIFGPESSGKTTLCLSVVAQSQKLGGICAFIDMEHALDPKYCETLGVDVDNLYISQPDTGEQAMEIAEELVRSGAIDVLVLDSVAALVPRAEIEGDMGDSHVGLQARLMSQALRKISGSIKATNTAFLLTNQLREKIGVMFGCFDADAPVLLADGTTEEIGDLVNYEMPVEVLSYNEVSETFEARPVVNWYNNGQAETFLEFTVAAYGDREPHRFACTPNHLLLTEEGYIAAEDLQVGDNLITAVPSAVTPATLQEPILAIGSQGGSALFEPQLLRAENLIPVPMPILSIETKPPSDDMTRFDIEVEGNHCYVVDGVVVHNSPETTTGGRALRFYASVRLDIRRIQAIKQGEEVIGNRTRVKVVKNKVAPPFRQAEFDLMYNEGFSMEGDVLDIGTEIGIVEKRGAFYRYNDGLIGQGRENAKQYLRDNPDLMYELEALIRQAATTAPLPVTTAAGEVTDEDEVAFDE